MRTDNLWKDNAAMNSHGFELIIDSFAGGGGASVGITAATGRQPDIAINHNPLAIEQHEMNHPDTLHFPRDIWKVDPAVATQGRPVGMMWASPDCTHHSVAKGGKPRKKKIRGLAWVIVKWAAAVRPRVIFLENVREFAKWGPLDKNGKPIKAREGQTFRQWIRKLEALGYEVEHRNMNAADYGAPTARRRLFLVARCDGQPIVWPKPTHGPGKGKKPYHTAAECIDFSRPCPSIFDRKKPLVENTMRRIARGLKRYVLDAKEPFIVTTNHGGDCFRGQGLDEPLNTITASSRCSDGLVLPYLSKYHGPRPGEKDGRCGSCGEPVKTLDTSNRFALVAAFLAKHYTGVTGHEVTRPIGTITAKDHHSLVAAHMTKFYNTTTGSDMRKPMPTITGGGQHIAEVRAFLIKYYGTGGQDQAVNQPLHTITAKERFGLVTVQGVEYQIVDIGLRMLAPEELLRAQFGKYAAGYKLIGTQTQQVAMIGNSVSPENAEAVVAANYTPQLARVKEATA